MLYSIWLSASSWLHGTRVWTFCNSWVLSTPFPSVRTTVLSSLQNAGRRTFERKLNSSVLLLSASRNFCQFLSTTAFPTTRFYPNHTFSYILSAHVILVSIQEASGVLVWDEDRSYPGLSECHSWYQVVIFLHRRTLMVMLGSYAERTRPDCHISFDS